MSKRNANGRFGGKGYYIALVLCAAAIGISGYLYYQNDTDSDLDSQQVSVQPDDGQMNVPGNTQPDPSQSAPGATEGNGNAGSNQPKLKTAAPLEGEMIAEYAMECLSYNQTTRDWRVHNGVDIAAEAGTPVLAAADGTVYTVYEDETMGTTVVIRHQDGYVTRYASLAKEVPVSPGDAVTMGQTIGCVGQTALLESALGDHLHFAVTCNDKAMDPQQFLNGN